MRRVAIGPITATGVALLVAGVVVANPINAPRSDLRIPAVQLSAGVDTSGTGMLDESFLRAIAPTPPESTSPIAVLRQLIDALAADVSYFGRNTLVEAFVAGVASVAQPNLTAASSPYPDPSRAGEFDLGGISALSGPSSAPIVWSAPESAAASATASHATAVPTVAVPLPDPALVIGSLLPAAHQAVAALAAEVHRVGDELAAAAVAAAYATGALVSVEPDLIAATLRALAAGDVEAALASAVKAVEAPLRPPAMILEALRTVVQRHLSRQVRDESRPVPTSGPRPAGAARIEPARAQSTARKSPLAEPSFTAPTVTAPTVTAIRVPGPLASITPAVNATANPLTLPGRDSGSVGSRKGRAGAASGEPAVTRTAPHGPPDAESESGATSRRGR